MATNLLEIVSLLEKINLATINNPKVLQNAVKAIEVISNNSNSSIRQKALIFQEKLKENPTFIELNKKEETKQAEIQQERIEKLQEQLQAKRAVSASDKIEKEKKEEKQEKIKEQEFKTLLTSSNWNSLPLWQQLDVLDYAFSNYESLSSEEKTLSYERTMNLYKQEKVTPELQATLESTQQRKDEKNEDFFSKPRTAEEIAQFFKKNKEDENSLKLGAKVAVEANSHNKTSTNDEKNKSNQLNQSLIHLHNFARDFKGEDNYSIVINPDGSFQILERKNGIWQKSTSEKAEKWTRSQLAIAEHNAIKDQAGLDKVIQLKQHKIQELDSQHFKPENQQDIFGKINSIYADLPKEIETLKQQNVFGDYSEHTIKLSSKDFLFSDVIKSNSDATMGFHIMMKDFIKGIHKPVNERDVDAYALFAHCPFVEKLLNDGRNGEITLKSIMENQWWWGKHCDLLIADMKRIMQEPDFKEKVEQAKQHIIPIEEFREKYAENKLQDSLVAYFKAQHSESYQKLAEKYPEFKDERFYDHLITRDVKELIAFIEKESGGKIKREDLIPYLKERGLRNENDIDKVLDNNGLGEETKQENVAKNDENKESQNDFLSKFQTKEQIEEQISENSKRLGYETANPSKSENQEQNNNSMQYNQSTSIISNT